MLYNVPGRTGQDIPDEVVLSLAESHPDSFLGESSKKEKKNFFSFLFCFFLLFLSLSLSMTQRGVIWFSFSSAL